MQYFFFVIIVFVKTCPLHFYYISCGTFSRHTASFKVYRGFDSFLGYYTGSNDYYNYTPTLVSYKCIKCRSVFVPYHIDFRRNQFLWEKEAFDGRLHACAVLNSNFGDIQSLFTFNSTDRLRFQLRSTLFSTCGTIWSPVTGISDSIPRNSSRNVRSNWLSIMIRMKWVEKIFLLRCFSFLSCLILSNMVGVSWIFYSQCFSTSPIWHRTLPTPMSRSRCPKNTFTVFPMFATKVAENTPVSAINQHHQPSCLVWYSHNGNALHWNLSSHGVSFGWFGWCRGCGPESQRNVR